MTVEQLIELLREQHPQALVLIELRPCSGEASALYCPPPGEADPVSVYSRGRNGRVYIEAVGQDC